MNKCCNVPNLTSLVVVKVNDAVQDAAVLEEVLRMVLEIINSCFIHQVFVLKTTYRHV